jgi:Uma2 family endonuclease
MGMATTPTPHATRHFTADEVWRMVEVGLLDPDEPYELIDGELQYMSPQGEPHAQIITRLNMLLAATYGPIGHVVRVQCPVVGYVDSIPEPDLAVVSEDVNEGSRHPIPDEAVLLIEVGVTSQRRDTRKATLYAQAGAAEYWIVDVPKTLIRVHAGPQADGTWESVRDVDLDGQLALPATDQTIDAAAVLRPAR